MKMTKKVLSILLSLMLVLGAVAVGGMSASAELSGDAWLDIGSDTAIHDGDIKKSEGTGWSITETENGITLNLDNLDLTYDGSCIYANNLDLKITGSAKLTSNYQNAIYLSNGSLTLDGRFTFGASCQNTVSVDSHLTVEGGSLSVINTGNFNAVSVVEAMTVNGGSVYAKTESSLRKAIRGIIILNNGEAFALGDEFAKEVLISALKGSGSAGAPYEIGSYAGLKEFASIVNGTNVAIAHNSAACAKLMKDIDASASAEANDWTPIGKDYDHQYTGTFDGLGNKITGLNFNNPQQDYAGLFGYVGTKTEGGVTTKGTVKNVGLEGGSITGNIFVGGVAGRNFHGTITNCYNTADISGKTYVGGVAGYNEGTVTNCYNTGDISGNERVGGVAGDDYNSIIAGCYNTGYVSGRMYIGGVVGINRNNSSVTDCYNTGYISSNNRAGGVVGSNSNSSVINCYTTGNIISGDKTEKVGIIVGYSEGINGNTATVKNCCYDSDRVNGFSEIGEESGEGETSSNVTGLTTAQMTGANALDNLVFEYGGGEVSPWQTKANGADVSGNYYLFYPHLKGFDYDLTAASEGWPAKVEVSVIWSEEDSYTYNGTKQAPEVASVTIGDSTVPEDYSASYSKYTGSEWGDESSDSPTDPGKYRMIIRDGDEVIETKYFKILEPDADYTVSYKVKSDDIWKDASEPVNAGEYKAIVTFTDTGYLKGQPPIEKAFNIAPKPVAVTACGPDGPIKAYTGQEQVHTDSVIWIYDREETGLDDSKLRYTGNTTVKGTNAGRHSVDLSAEYCFCDDSNYDVTFTAEGDFDFDIAQSVLTITADDLETNYGEDLAGLTYKIEPRFGSYYNTDELGITLSTNADKNKAGTYDITVTVPDNPNYLITTQKGTYTVRQIDPGATVTAEDIDYGQKAVVTFTVPADATGKVTFYLDAADTGITKDIENGQAVCEFEKPGIGTHDVECVYTGDGNYNPGETKTAGFEVKSVDCPLTINYVYADGSEAYETYNGNVTIFNDYSITSPEITGYAPDTATVEGAMGDDDMGGKTVTVTYTANTYTATFVDENGETVKEVKFTVEDDSIDEPAVPGKEGYEGKWSEYTLALSDIEIAAEYTAIEYTATFVDENGETVAEIPYTVETEKLEAPAVPVKEGYNGEWEEYELTPGGITVKPVYTPADICPLDNEYHGDNFWGRLVKFFHTVIWKAFNLVGINIYLKIW